MDKFRVILRCPLLVWRVRVGIPNLPELGYALSNKFVQQRRGSGIPVGTVTEVNGNYTGIEEGCWPGSDATPMGLR
jgi:hypothetical protein